MHAYIPLLQEISDGKRFITWDYNTRSRALLTILSWLFVCLFRSFNPVCSSHQVDEFSGANPDTLKEKLDNFRT